MIEAIPLVEIGRQENNSGSFEALAMRDQHSVVAGLGRTRCERWPDSICPECIEGCLEAAREQAEGGGDP